MLVLIFFLAVSDLTCHLEDTGMFSGCTVLPDNKESKHGSSDQEASPKADKNPIVVLVPCRTWKCVPGGTFDGVDLSDVPVYQLLQQMSSQ